MVELNVIDGRVTDEGKLCKAAPAMLAILQRIVIETMPYSPMRAYGSDDLAHVFVEEAQRAIELATGSRIHEYHGADWHVFVDALGRRMERDAADGISNSEGAQK